MHYHTRLVQIDISNLVAPPNSIKSYKDLTKID